jgi:integrase/recombinase XerC
MQLELFLKYLRLEKRYSGHTVRAYKIDLEQFVKYFSISDSNSQAYEDIDIKDIRAWIVCLMESHSVRTVNRKISSVRSFYSFLQKKEIILHNPVEKVQAPKMVSGLPEFIPESQLNNISKNFIGYESDFSIMRDYLLLEFLYNTGIRQAELIGICNKDVYLSEKLVKVLGKRNKERLIPLTSFLLELIYKYINLKKTLSFLDNKDDPFFVTNKGGKLYPSFVYKKVNYYLSQVTSIEKKSPHVLRHSFATHMLNNGADINAIKDLLGHSSLAATQVYTHNSFEKLKRVYNQAHPRAEK